MDAGISGSGWLCVSFVRSTPHASVLEAFLFFLFAALAVFGGLGLLISRSPVAGVLWMVQAMIAIACLYLTMDATFIGVIQIMVYAGAIMVLFLFVIMLLNLEKTPALGTLTGKMVVGFLLGVVILAQILAVLIVQVWEPEGEALAADPQATDVEALGVALLTEHAYSLEMIGVLLLAATIGAVILAKRRFV